MNLTDPEHQDLRRQLVEGRLVLGRGQAFVLISREACAPELLEVTREALLSELLRLRSMVLEQDMVEDAEYFAERRADILASPDAVPVLTVALSPEGGLLCSVLDLASATGSEDALCSAGDA